MPAVKPASAPAENRNSQVFSEQLVDVPPAPHEVDFDDPLFFADPVDDPIPVDTQAEIAGEFPLQAFPSRGVSGDLLDSGFYKTLLK